MESKSCVLCGKDLDAGEIVVVTRGLETLRKCSLARCNGIHNALEGLNIATVHALCRNNYTRRPDVAAVSSSSTTTVSEKHTLRSGVINFDYKTQCFFVQRRSGNHINTNIRIDSHRLVK